MRRYTEKVRQRAREHEIRTDRTAQSQPSELSPALHASFRIEEWKRSLLSQEEKNVNNERRIDLDFESARTKMQETLNNSKSSQDLKIKMLNSSLPSTKHRGLPQQVNQTGFRNAFAKYKPLDTACNSKPESENTGKCENTKYKQKYKNVCYSQSEGVITPFESSTYIPKNPSTNPCAITVASPLPSPALPKCDDVVQETAAFPQPRTNKRNFTETSAIEEMYSTGYKKSKYDFDEEPFDFLNEIPNPKKVRINFYKYKIPLRQTKLPYESIKSVEKGSVVKSKQKIQNKNDFDQETKKATTTEKGKNISKCNLRSSSHLKKTLHNDPTPLSTATSSPLQKVKPKNIKLKCSSSYRSKHDKTTTDSNGLLLQCNNTKPLGKICGEKEKSKNSGECETQKTVTDVHQILPKLNIGKKIKEFQQEKEALKSHSRTQKMGGKSKPKKKAPKKNIFEIERLFEPDKNITTKNVKATADEIKINAEMRQQAHNENQNLQQSTLSSEKDYIVTKKSVEVKMQNSDVFKEVPKTIETVKHLETIIQGTSLNQLTKHEHFSDNEVEYIGFFHTANKKDSPIIVSDTLVAADNTYNSGTLTLVSHFSECVGNEKENSVTDITINLNPIEEKQDSVTDFASTINPGDEKQNSESDVASNFNAMEHVTLDILNSVGESLPINIEISSETNSFINFEPVQILENSSINAEHLELFEEIPTNFEALEILVNNQKHNLNNSELEQVSEEHTYGSNLSINTKQCIESEENSPSSQLNGGTTDKTIENAVISINDIFIPVCPTTILNVIPVERYLHIPDGFQDSDGKIYNLEIATDETEQDIHSFLVRKDISLKISNSCELPHKVKDMSLNQHSIDSDTNISEESQDIPSCSRDYELLNFALKLYSTVLSLKNSQPCADEDINNIFLRTKVAIAKKILKILLQWFTEDASTDRIFLDFYANSESARSSPNIFAFLQDVLEVAVQESTYMQTFQEKKLVRQMLKNLKFARLHFELFTKTVKTQNPATVTMKNSVENVTDECNCGTSPQNRKDLLKTCLNNSLAHPKKTNDTTECGLILTANAVKMNQTMLDIGSIEISQTEEKSDRSEEKMEASEGESSIALPNETHSLSTPSKLISSVIVLRSDHLTNNVANSTDIVDTNIHTSVVKSLETDAQKIDYSLPQSSVIDVSKTPSSSMISGNVLNKNVEKSTLVPIVQSVTKHSEMFAKNKTQSEESRGDNSNIQSPNVLSVQPAVIWGNFVSPNASQHFQETDTVESSELEQVENVLQKSCKSPTQIENGKFVSKKFTQEFTSEPGHSIMSASLMVKGSQHESPVLEHRLHLLNNNADLISFTSGTQEIEKNRSVIHSSEHSNIHVDSQESACLVQQKNFNGLTSTFNPSTQSPEKVLQNNALSTHFSSQTQNAPLNSESSLNVTMNPGSPDAASDCSFHNNSTEIRNNSSYHKKSEEIQQSCHAIAKTPQEMYDEARKTNLQTIPIPTHSPEQSVQDVCPPVELAINSLTVDSVTGQEKERTIVLDDNKQPYKRRKVGRSRSNLASTKRSRTNQPRTLVLSPLAQPTTNALRHLNSFCDGTEPWTSAHQQIHLPAKEGHRSSHAPIQSNTIYHSAYFDPALAEKQKSNFLSPEDFQYILQTNHSAQQLGDKNDSCHPKIKSLSQKNPFLSFNLSQNNLSPIQRDSNRNYNLINYTRNHMPSGVQENVPKRSGLEAKTFTAPETLSTWTSRTPHPNCSFHKNSFENMCQQQLNKQRRYPPLYSEAETKIPVSNLNLPNNLKPPYAQLETQNRKAQYQVSQNTKLTDQAAVYRQYSNMFPFYQRLLHGEQVFLHEVPRDHFQGTEFHKNTYRDVSHSLQDNWDRLSYLHPAASGINKEYLQQSSRVLKNDRAPNEVMKKFHGPVVEVETQNSPIDLAKKRCNILKHFRGEQCVERSTDGVASEASPNEIRASEAAITPIMYATEYRKRDADIPESGKCKVCGILTDNMCSECGQVFYCCKECQQRLEVSHKHPQY